MGLDETLFGAINTGWANAALDPVMAAISLLGSYAVVLYVLPLWYSGRKTRSFDYLLALAVVVVLTAVLKAAIGRMRPEEVLGLGNVRLVPVPFSSETDPAFPSGHVARVALLAAVVSPHERKFALPMAAFVLLEALSRIYVGVHWPTDTMGGAALGAAVGLVVWRLDRVDRYARVRAAVLRPLGVTADRAGLS